MIIDNLSFKLKAIIYECLNISDEILICSPFISENDLLFDILKQDKIFTLICRLTYPATPDLFEKILDLLDDNKKVYVYDDNSLHAKIYYFKKNKKGICAIIGSSNFTDSGISLHKEVNVLIDYELVKIERYFEFLKKESYKELSKEVIEYYRSFYKKPDLSHRYRKVKIKNEYVELYESILNRYNIAKGLLIKRYETKLPFTYLFDLFCHEFKTKIIYDYHLEPFHKFKKKYLFDYFKIFIEQYFTKDDENWRLKRFKRNIYLKQNLKKISEWELKLFFLNLHAIASGSGMGMRTWAVKNRMVKEDLIKLINFIINKDLSMSQKFALALTKKQEGGLKIDYLGKSCIGEIPGWLMPEQYPIINEKMKFVLDFFKL